MDWKEALLKQSLEMGIDPADAPEAETSPAAESGEKAWLRTPLNMIMERKGRGGKTATIIEGFTCPPDELKKIATRLKSSLGTGGSVRGSEILIQGDRRSDAAIALKAMGFTTIKGVPK